MTPNKNDLMNPMHSYSQLVDIYAEGCKDLDNNILNLGLPTLHKKMRGFRKQELISFLAKSGVGKSILVKNATLNFLDHSNELACIFSLEMSAYGVAERLMQLKTKQSGEVIEQHFVAGDSAFEKEVRSHDLSRLFVYTKRIDVYDIPNVISKLAQREGKAVGLIVCDHVTILRNHKFPANEYARISDNMTMLYDYAKTLNVGVLNVSQISREDGKMDKISLYGGKGSGEVENSSDFVISFELVERNEDESSKLSEQQIAENNMLELIERSGKAGKYRLMKLRMLKTRRGEQDTVYLLFDKQTIKIQEFNAKLL